MQIPITARGLACALLVSTALLLGSGIALADETEEKGESITVTKSKMHVVVQDADGKRTVKVLEMKDGEWVAVEDAVEEDEKVVEWTAPRVRMRVGHAPGGAVMLRKQGEKAHGAALPKAKGNPLASALRWFHHGAGGMAEGSQALEAWFAGDDKALSGLRDALKADGWTAQGFQDWMHQHMTGAHGQAAPSAPRTHTWFGHAPTPAPNPWMQGPWGMQPPMPWGMQGGHQGHPMWGQPRVPTQSKGYVLWNDGSGWQTREIPMQSPHAMPYGAPWGYAMPYGYPNPWYGMGHGGGGGSCLSGACPNCRAKQGPGAAPWMHFFGPQGPHASQGADETSPWIENLPPEVRDAIRGHIPDGAKDHAKPEWKVLRGAMPEGIPESVLRGLMEGSPSVRSLILTPQGGCRDCPKQGACKGGCKGKGDCKGKGGGCSGNCEDCPNKGSCGGSCDDCPNKGSCRGACKDGGEKADCCGTCRQGKAEPAGAK